MVTTPNSERFLLAAPIFDDPGYDQGFKLMNATTETSNENEPHLYHTLEPQFSSETSQVVEATDRQKQMDSTFGYQESDQVSPSNARGIGRNPQISKSTLALLDFCDEELQEMDPDLLSHLQNEDKDYAV